MLLQEGVRAVEFCLPDNSWERTCLNEFKNKKVILYFFPENSTWENIKEACKFRDAYEEIIKYGATVVGVSPDKPRVHERMREKYKLPFLLLSDTDHKIAEAYGASEEKQFLGRKYKGVLRSTYIIDERGKIQKVFTNINLEDHIDEVLYSLKN
jgi:thioredoxin-dependent peroxiredoxin